MLPPEELIAHLKKQPFEPFRIRMADGAAYEIRHPEVILVGHRTITVGLARSGEPSLPYQRIETAALLHIIRLEPIETQSHAG
jgi:hypothetical protein